MACDDAGREFVRLLVQGAVVVVGWMVVHKLSVGRDRDKARRELVAKSADALSDGVEEILVEAYGYHTTDRSVSAELKLKSKLQDLSVRLNGLTDLIDGTSTLASCRSAVIGLKRAVTSEHFEDEHTEVLGEDSAQLQEIASEALRVKHALMNLKHQQFPK